jgi:hypothetical protein
MATRAGHPDAVKCLLRQKPTRFPRLESEGGATEDTAAPAEEKEHTMRENRRLPIDTDSAHNGPEPLTTEETALVRGGLLQVWPSPGSCIPDTQRAIPDLPRPRHPLPPPDWWWTPRPS